jgi:hypothetical protein
MLKTSPALTISSFIPLKKPKAFGGPLKKTFLYKILIEFKKSQCLKSLQSGSLASIGASV